VASKAHLLVSEDLRQSCIRLQLLNGDHSIMITAGPAGRSGLGLRHDWAGAARLRQQVNNGHQSEGKKIKASHTRYRAFGPELIPVYRQSAHR